MISNTTSVPMSPAGGERRVKSPAGEIGAVAGEEVQGRLEVVSKRGGGDVWGGGGGGGGGGGVVVAMFGVVEGAGPAGGGAHQLLLFRHFCNP